MRPTLFAPLLLLLASGCDLDWEERAEAAFQRGLAAEAANEVESARTQFEQALGGNPYHPGATLRLAELYATRIFEGNGSAGLAIFYAERYLDLRCGDAQDRGRAETILETLRPVVSGALEDPSAAAADLCASARAPCAQLFLARLDPRLVKALEERGISLEDYLASWNQMLKGRSTRPVRRWIESARGERRATVSFAVVGSPSGVKEIDVHLAADPDGAWRLAGFRKSESSEKPAAAK